MISAFQNITKVKFKIIILKNRIDQSYLQQVICTYAMGNVNVSSTLNFSLLSFQHKRASSRKNLPTIIFFINILARNV